MGTRFWQFSQNNSGGSFDYDEERGVTHHVVIEAKSADHASALAQDIGLYFDGVREGRDCGCCGDRWSEPWDEGDPEPMVCSAPAAKVTSSFGGWMKDGREICVHYLDGRKEWYGVKVID